MILPAELCPLWYLPPPALDSQTLTWTEEHLSLSSPLCSLPTAGGPMFLAQMDLLPNCLLICQVVVPSRCSHVGIWRPASVHKQLIASLFCFWSGPNGAPPRPWIIFQNWPEDKFSAPLFLLQSISFNHLCWFEKLCMCILGFLSPSAFLLLLPLVLIFLSE